MDRGILRYLKQITSKDLLYSTGKSAQCYLAARMGTYVSVTESLCCPPETLTTLLISYTPKQN